MTISAISAAMSASYLYGYGNSELNKLLDNLIEDDESVSSVSASSISDASKAASVVEETEEEEETEEKTDESSDLRDRAESLAQKLGITVDEDDTIDDIIDEIQEAIDEEMQVAANRNDRAYFDTLRSYQIQLDCIAAENDGGGVMPSVVYDFMDMVAEQNKFALGIPQK